MILGIKTTDGVSKLKTKTADGVTKAVECACCNPCDPNALWGPGYDDQPSEIELFGYTLQRIEVCKWQISACFNDSSEIVWIPICASENDSYGDGLIVELNQGYYYPDLMLEGPQTVARFFAPVIGGTYEINSGEAIRTGGDNPAPYGTYTVVGLYDEYSNPLNIGDTFTISPPA